MYSILQYVACLYIVHKILESLNSYTRTHYDNSFSYALNVCLLTSFKIFSPQQTGLVLTAT